MQIAKAYLLVVAVLLLCQCNRHVEKNTSSAQKMKPTFESIQARVLPNCVKCHNGEEVDLRTYDEVVKNSNTVVPGNPEDSSFYERLARPKGKRGFMPKGGEPVSAETLKAVYDWIKEGAKP